MSLLAAALVGVCPQDGAEICNLLERGDQEDLDETGRDLKMNSPPHSVVAVDTLSRGIIYPVMLAYFLFSLALGCMSSEGTCQLMKHTIPPIENYTTKLRNFSRYESL